MLSQYYGYIILFVVLLLAAAVATFMVGVSRANTEGNPQYEKRTRGNFTRLSFFYGISLVIGFIIVLIFISILT